MLCRLPLVLNPQMVCRPVSSPAIAQPRPGDAHHTKSLIRHANRKTVSPFTITKENAAAVQVALDQRILDAKVQIGVHASKSDETAFVSGSEIQKYLESTGVKVTVVDFSLVSVYVLSPGFRELCRLTFGPQASHFKDYNQQAPCEGCEA